MKKSYVRPETETLACLPVEILNLSKGGGNNNNNNNETEWKDQDGNNIPPGSNKDPDADAKGWTMPDLWTDD